MSEQIREQVSAFLDGELPASETELLLKRLTRDAELRHSFGRYALIGETLRGSSRTCLTRSFAARVNRAIDGEPASPPLQAIPSRNGWWRPIAGTAVAAGVAAVAVVALQQRAVAPGVRASSTAITAQNVRAVAKEPLSYTVVPAVATAASTPPVVPAARFTSYVFAHSKYSVGLGQGSLLSALLTDADDQPASVQAGTGQAAAAAAGGDSTTQPREPRTAP
jgi:sigma-E factor negative regulatory protein RseA